MSIRANRVAEQIKKEFGIIVQQKIRDSRIGFVTVTGTDVSKDLQSAKIYISILGDEKSKKSSMIALNRAQGYIRTELGRRLKLRQVPEITLHLDSSQEYGSHISSLISEVMRDSNNE